MNNLSILKFLLRVFGVTLLMIAPLMKFDPFGGWAWTPSQGEYELMIQSIYMTMGLMMIFAAKEPVKHAFFIWFVVWSSVAHAGVMAYLASLESIEHGHFMGDVPALFLMAAALGITLRKEQHKNNPI